MNVILGYLSLKLLVFDLLGSVPVLFFCLEYIFLYINFSGFFVVCFPIFLIITENSFSSSFVRVAPCRNYLFQPDILNVT